MRPRARRAAIEQLTTTSADTGRVVLATGRYIGEGFDDSRLDTLLLAMPIYACLIAAIRRLAPTRPMLTGAAAGFAAGALAATLYGLHCPEQAAAFVATWYTLGIGAATALGAIAGRRLLRW